MALGRLLISVAVLGLVGCTGKDGTGNGDDTGGADDTGGGGGTGTLWRPAGQGTAWFLDGTADNSLFHLEMTRVNEPREGEAYYGWISVSGDASSKISVGEIAVTGDEVVFEFDVGENAIIAGYDTFEAWASTDGMEGSGEQLWAGQVNTVIFDVIQNLLISSDSTPDGQGSLRSVETAVEAIRVRAQEAVDGEFSLDSFTEEAEAVSNGLAGTSTDRNDDGTVTTMEGQLGIIGESGYVELIKADLDAASAQVDPGDPIKDFANYAYDCTQAIEAHADNAADEADVATICTGEESCDERMTDAIVEIDYALSGQDVNEDGTIDLLTEGTIECAISYVSEMAQMTVETP